MTIFWFVAVLALSVAGAELRSVAGAGEWRTRTAAEVRWLPERMGTQIWD
jgi:hypothetical protein